MMHREEMRFLKNEQYKNKFRLFRFKDHLHLEEDWFFDSNNLNGFYCCHSIRINQSDRSMDWI